LPANPPAEPSKEPSFDAVWAVADRIPGWLTREQARLLYDHALALAPGATMLEIGSHQGRSTVVLAEVARRRNTSLVAVDPFVEGRLFGGLTTKEKFEAHLKQLGLRDRVELVEEYSTALRPTWHRELDLLYIDGKHDFWTVSDDLRWAAHLPRHGRVLIHDCFSSIGVTLGILARVLPGRQLTYLSRTGSMAVFERGRPSMRDRLRILGEVPWWCRNVVIKVLLRARLRGVARALGHDSPYDPY